ncbi:MAG: histidinol-phosphatase [bacterium]|nr:histidinol-phosphatase [bacterium]
MGDYHVHLHNHGPYSGFGPPLGEYPRGHIESYVEHAASNGLTDVGFTEHLYRCVESVPVLGHFWENDTHDDLAAETEEFVTVDRTLSIESYVAAVVDAKDRGYPVKLGLEVDFFPDTIDAVLDFLKPYPWDFLIGAVHWIGAWAVDYPPSAHEFERRGIRQAYEDYFEVERQLAASGTVDVLAHVDVVKVHGHVLEEPPLELYAATVAAAASSGTAVEVSSAGIHKPVGEMYPAPTFLQLFGQADVPITLASDAHEPSQCGRDADVLAAAAREAGYSQHLVFDDRIATRQDLPNTNHRSWTH